MRNQRGIQLLAVAVVSAALSACGGGALGEDGTGGGGGGSTTVTIGTLTLQASKTQLNSDASAVANGVKLTALIRDGSNNVVSGVPVSFSTADSGEISVTNSATDGTGRAVATLTTGGDPENRTIDVTVTAGNRTATVSIDVVGTTLNFSLAPDNTQFGVATTYTVVLTDFGGNPISGIPVIALTNSGNTLNGTSSNTATRTTGSNGQATFTLNATVAASTLTVSALGLVATKNISVSTDQFTFRNPANTAQLATSNAEVNLGVCQPVVVQWFAGGNPVADGTIINFVATRGQLFGTSTCANPVVSSATIGNGTVPGGPALPGSGQTQIFIRSAQSGATQITASSNALTMPTSNLALEFVATVPNNITLQASPSTIATNQSSDLSVVVRDAAGNLVKNVPISFTLSDITGGTVSPASATTNSQGLAKSTYNSSLQPSARDGVVITAGITGTGLTSTARLTVGERAISIAFGGGAEVQIKDSSTYQMPFTVVVSDAAGNPVPTATFRLSAFPLLYLKGDRYRAVRANPSTAVSCANENVNRNNTLDTEDVNRNGVLDPGEDLDGDSILDTEDRNNNGRLDPGMPATVPATVALDPVDGSGQFFVTYAKEFGEYILLELTAVASVAGTEATAVRIVGLAIADTDADNLPALGPFGNTLDCTAAF